MHHDYLKKTATTKYSWFKFNVTSSFNSYTALFQEVCPDRLVVLLTLHMPGVEIFSFAFRKYFWKFSGISCQENGLNLLPSTDSLVSTIFKMDDKLILIYIGIQCFWYYFCGFSHMSESVSQRYQFFFKSGNAIRPSNCFIRENKMFYVVRSTDKLAYCWELSCYLCCSWAFF